MSHLELNKLFYFFLQIFVNFLENLREIQYIFLHQNSFWQEIGCFLPHWNFFFLKNKDF